MVNQEGECIHSPKNWLESSGHIWIPLQVSLQVPREQMIGAPATYCVIEIEID